MRGSQKFSYPGHALPSLLKSTPCPLRGFLPQSAVEFANTTLESFGMCQRRWRLTRLWTYEDTVARKVLHLTFCPYTKEVG